ncbi:efflux RND transporter periplasmic adaptor subunit [Micromonospora sp. Llam0]|uniref:efflux RND transporter periplasmic adaptor subunit n=1 Tax=Micromonospora sp. Llam0 TaxID=2485143 RepID=UPI000F48D82F|nr:biotin/lipoyl-binding protein [Micromonospora sp. Llam0]
MPVRHLAGLRRPLIINAVLAVAVLGTLGWTYYAVVGTDTAAADLSDTATVTVGQATVTATVTASGSVRSAKTAVADFVTSGTVTEILVAVGDQVDEGTVLARVDDAVAQRELDAAQANLDAARDALDTAETAGESTADADAEVADAELAVTEAQAAVDGTTLVAPMAGTVVAVNGSVGASSGGGTGTSSSGGGTGSAGSGAETTGSSSSASGFVDLADLTSLEVTASVSETDAVQLEVGQPATVQWNALADAEATATVGVIDPNATTTNGVVSYPITLDLDSVPDGVRPGQTVEATVVVGEAVDVLTVSPAALTGTGTRASVTVLVDGAQVSRTVEVGLRGADAVEIVSGLTAGEQVVITIPTESESGTGGFPGGSGFPGGGGLTGGGGFPGGGGLTGGGGR